MTHIEPPPEVVEAARWKCWQDEVCRILQAKYSYTEGMAVAAVYGVNGWREMYDDDYAPADAAHENELAGFN